MARIPFNIQLAKEGHVFLKPSGAECIFIKMDSHGFYYKQSNFATSMCCPIADLKDKDWSMKPKEDDIWGPWVFHDGGECPIPDVKAGDYELKFISGKIANPSALVPSAYGDQWRNGAIDKNFNIVAYRIKKHLLNPENEALLPPITPPIDDAHLTKESPKLKKTAFPLPKLDQYILHYVHEEPKGVLHEDEGMSRLISRLMK